jgi:hypothetical protein
MTRSLTQLVEARFTEAEILARADRDIGRDGHRHPDWYAGDPLNCTACSIAIEQAIQDCAAPGHRHTAGCWDDVRCPNHVGSAP